MNTSIGPRAGMRPAFSITELLVVIGIILALVALSMPVFTRAKHASLVAVSKSNLRQVYVMLELYRSDHSEQVSFGDPHSMGLPTPDWFLQETRAKGLIPPLANRYSNTGWYYYYVPDPVAEPPIKQSWLSQVTECQAGTVVAADFSFSDHEPFNGSPYTTKYGIGITLDGSLRERRSIGIPLSPKWWPCATEGGTP